VVQDLLDLSVLDRDPGALVLADVDLAQIVDSVLDRLEPALSEHHIERDLRPAPSVRGELNGIERVLTNLLTNAAKFSPAGSVITVGVGADTDGGGATLVVSDQGPGVPLEERAKVFTRFFRGSGEAVAHTRGVGIGLSVVADLVGAMDGRLEVDDAPGGGARFTVHLPAAQMSGEREVTDAPTA
jgi:two-component system sensor histidine kinase BaeS